MTERYLLDTNIVLAALLAPEVLSEKGRRILERGDSCVSVLAYWEVQIKIMKGKIEVGNVRNWWADALGFLNAVAVPLHPDHIHEIAALPSLHKDPFDRALIAQAAFEGMTIMTSDAILARYSDERHKILHFPLVAEIKF